MDPVHKHMLIYNYNYKYACICICSPTQLSPIEMHCEVSFAYELRSLPSMRYREALENFLNFLISFFHHNWLLKHKWPKQTNLKREVEIWRGIKIS